MYIWVHVCMHVVVFGGPGLWPSLFGPLVPSSVPVPYPCPMRSVTPFHYCSLGRFRKSVSMQNKRRRAVKRWENKQIVCRLRESDCEAKSTICQLKGKSQQESAKWSLPLELCYGFTRVAKCRVLLRIVKNK